MTSVTSMMVGMECFIFRRLANWCQHPGYLLVVVMSYTYARDSVDVVFSTFSTLLFLCLDAHNSHIWVSWVECATEWEGLSEIEKSCYYPCLVVDIWWVSWIKKKFWIALWYAMNWLHCYVSCILEWWVAEFSNYLASHFKEVHVQSKWSLPIPRITLAWASTVMALMHFFYTFYSQEHKILRRSGNW